MASRMLLSSIVLLFVALWVRAEEPKPIPPEQFAKLHKMIKPQPGELRFQDIPWLMSTYEARKKAAEEGKPILVWSGSGGAPVGVC
jgi:hypothetical protein